MELPNWLKPKQKPKPIAEIAAENRKAYMDQLNIFGWDTLGSEVEMLPVYVDAKGYNYYIGKNIWQGVSSDRRFALEEAALAMEFRQSRQQRIEAGRERLLNMQKAINGDIEAARNAHKSQWEELEIMRKSPSDSILMEYAVHVLFTDGEDPNTLSPAMLQTKRDRAEIDPGLRAFFLDMALASVNNFLPTLPHDGPGFSQEEETEQKKRKGEATRNQLAAFMNKGKEKTS